VAMEWDLDRFAQAVKGGSLQASHQSQQTRLEKLFKMVKLGAVDKPATVVDRHGNIILWYLPNILQTNRVVGVSRPC